MLLDTNALLLPVRLRFPLESEVHRLCPGATLAVPSSVVDELGKLAEEEVPGARVASELSRRYPVVPVKARGDQGVVEAARRRRSWVVTADRALSARLRQFGVSVLVPRDRHRLELHPGRAVPASGAAATPTRKPARRRQRL